MSVWNIVMTWNIYQSKIFIKIKFINNCNEYDLQCIIKYYFYKTIQQNFMLIRVTVVRVQPAVSMELIFFRIAASCGASKEGNRANPVGVHGDHARDSRQRRRRWPIGGGGQGCSLVQQSWSGNFVQTVISCRPTDSWKVAVAVAAAPAACLLPIRARRVVFPFSREVACAVGFACQPIVSIMATFAAIAR